MIPFLDLEEQLYRDSPLVQKLTDFTVVVRPDKIKAQWSVGAPSVYISEEGVFYMAVRMREGDSPRGKRGYEIRILKSSDGIHFKTINRILREDTPFHSFGRPILVRDAKSGDFKLYGCAKRKRFGWYVFKCADRPSPSDFSPETIIPVLKPDRTYMEYIQVVGYKDPVIYWDGRVWHMYVVGLDRVERIHHFRSYNGQLWEHMDPLIFLDNSGWHNYSTRPSAILPLAVGYLFIYEGAHHTWNDPDYNVATGLAYSPDLMRCIDLTPEYPLLISTTPGEYFTWRQSCWLLWKNKLYVYFEAVLPYNSTEIRLSVVEMPLCI